MRQTWPEARRNRNEIIIDNHEDKPVANLACLTKFLEVIEPSARSASAVLFLVSIIVHHRIRRRTSKSSVTNHHDTGYDCDSLRSGTLVLQGSLRLSTLVRMCS